MKTKKSSIYILVSVLSLFLFGSGQAANCAFDLPPNELIIINGDRINPKILTCEVKTNGEDNYHLLSFSSESNTSIVNNLILPEGTIMSLSFTALDNNKLTFELKDNARLGITNDTSEFIKLACDQA